MPINVCRGCGKEFEAATRRASYCPGECFREKERQGTRARVAKYSPERRRAAVVVQLAMTRGDLKPRPCEVCGRGYTVAHHDDYASPLDVRWLCRSHHRRHHHKFGPGLNAFRADEVAA